MTKTKKVAKIAYLMPRQAERLALLSEVSGKSQTSLIVEALELLFRTPKGEIK